MIDHVLTLNAGSSSVKFALFPREGGHSTPRLSGLADGLGERARFRLRDRAGVWHDAAELAGEGGGAATHADALAAILRALHEGASDATVVGVGHRIVHGGAAFDHPVIVDEGVLGALAELVPLAPLHQPHNVEGVRAALRAFPGVPQVACFDTAFHRTQPALNQHYALPRALYDEGVRRYGFHGLSYESIAMQLAMEGGSTSSRRVVIAHLGNGASLCAMHHGRSVATTMGFSPLDGLPMGTRCGRLDPGVVLYLLQGRGMDAARVAQLLYRESGLIGLSGISSDMRELEASAEPAAREAIDYFVEHARREIAAMAAALGGIDLLVFTGGIGENATAIRSRIVGGLAWMGLALDEAANARGAGCISTAEAVVEVRVMHTNEEAVIARHTTRALEAAAA